MSVEKVWVFAVWQNGAVTPGSQELLTKAKSLGQTVEAVLIGPGAQAGAADLGKYGASTVYVGDSAELENILLGGPAADALASLVEQHHPDVILFNGSYVGRDVAGRLAAKLDAPVMANLTDISADSGVTAMTSIFGAT